MEEVYALKHSEFVAEAVPDGVWWAGAVASVEFNKMLRLQAEALEQHAAWCWRHSAPARLRYLDLLERHLRRVLCTKRLAVLHGKPW